MSHYRKIDVRIWNDAKFNSLTTAGKLGFFMLLTHPMMTALGAMRGTPGGLAEEIGMDPELFREGFRELLQHGMAEHDPKGPMIALPNFLKYNPPPNPNAVKAWAKSLEFLPECELKAVVIQRAKGLAEQLGKPFLEPFLQPENREQRAESKPPFQERGEDTSTRAHGHAREGEQNNSYAKAKGGG
jgi:hypothetical protein